MRDFNRTVLVAIALWSTATAGSAIAQETWPPPGVSFYGDPAAPDISGLWQGSMIGVPGVQPAPNRGPADGAPQTYWTPWPLPYTPAYQKILDDRTAAYAVGRQLGDITARCLPFGMPRGVSTRVYPDEIVQTPGQVTFFVNSSMPLVVWTDGRGHPTDLKPSFDGHSIGHWIGDTLFAETVGINNLTSLDHSIIPHSDKLKMKWTVRRAAPDRLHIALTLEDEEAFTEPVVTTNIYRRKSDPNWQVLDDGSCFENNRTAVDEDGDTDGFTKF